MTAEALITELETLPPAEQKKFFSYLSRRAANFASVDADEEGISDAEFGAALRKVMVENHELLHRLAQ